MAQARLNYTFSEVARLKIHFRSQPSSYVAWRDALTFDLLSSGVPAARIVSLRVATIIAADGPNCRDYYRLELDPARGLQLWLPGSVVRELRSFVQTALPALGHDQPTGPVLLQEDGTALSEDYVRDMLWRAAVHVHAELSPGLPLKP